MPRRKRTTIPVGTKFHLLTVVEYVGFYQKPGTKDSRRHYYRCRCDCGNETLVKGDNLVSGNTKACGCLRRKHGHHPRGRKSSTYQAWGGMRDRCLNTADKRYADYGGRGITICERWDSFRNFLADMGEKPAGLTLGRKDNDGSYSPENCRWETWRQQQNNRRSNCLKTMEGRTQTVAQWAREFGVPRGRVYQRLQRGWSTRRALTEPKRQARQRFDGQFTQMGLEQVRFPKDD